MFQQICLPAQRPSALCRALSGLVVLAAACLCASVVHADPIGDMLRATSTKLAPSIVSIRAVSTMTTKSNGQTSDHDVTAQFCGVIVSTDGLIMCSDDYFSSDRVKDAIGMPSDAPGTDISVKPREIRVTIGDEGTEYYGSLAASDSSLGLAFIQIRDLNGRTLPVVDLSGSQNADDLPSVGDPTTSVTRLSKTFDYTPLAVEDRVVAIVTKPRKAYVPEGFAGSLGLPVCGSDGNIIGVVSSFPRGEQSQEDYESTHISALFDDVVNEDRTQIVLPTSVVAPLIGEAKAQAAALPPFVKPQPKPAEPSTGAKTPETSAAAPHSSHTSAAAK